MFMTAIANQAQQAGVEIPHAVREAADGACLGEAEILGALDPRWFDLPSRGPPPWRAEGRSVLGERVVVAKSTKRLLWLALRFLRNLPELVKTDAGLASEKEKGFRRSDLVHEIEDPLVACSLRRDVVHQNQRIADPPLNKELSGSGTTRHAEPAIHKYQIWRLRHSIPDRPRRPGICRPRVNLV
ncbi:hypothetical protein GXW78_09665 [Roseomonas terrae]|uniref:Uncharacterized protein n=2 Tax=Neoroseomonas terrae TaxID=424799 RepID=A0ABS5EFZ0_9PROT|nr:hypothetical protein [Neoroseomonas terrae]